MSLPFYKTIFAAFALAPLGLFAQDSSFAIVPDKGPEKSQEIVIRNKGDKDVTLNVEIKGDKVTINGKPLDEYKDDDISIRKRVMITKLDRLNTLDGVLAFDDQVHAFNNQAQLYGQQNRKFYRKGGPFLGVTTDKVDEGAKITKVITKSAAEKAGLKEGDIITQIGDEKVEDGMGLTTIIGAKKAKDPVKISYLRNGKKATTTATLGERKESDAMVYSFSSPQPDAKDFQVFRDGQGAMSYEPHNFNYNFDYGFDMMRQKKIGLKIQDTEEGGNVKVIGVEEGSAAEKAGLKKDDVITEINGEKVENTDEAREQLSPEEGKYSYPVKALRNGSAMSFDIKIPKKLKTADL